MEHRCYICKEVVPEAELQNRVQPPGNYLSCQRHKEQVSQLNIKLREIQSLRREGSYEQAEELVLEMKSLESQYGVSW